MTDTERESEPLIVVGMNRTRLLKIMAMVGEDGPGGEDIQPAEYIPCVASMSSYEGQDGEQVRYMSSFVFHDGSPMTLFFDDEGFRKSLRKVIMVGYEWKEFDRELVEKYFEANLLSVAIECIGPNPEFSSLSEEMHHYKNLTSEEKEEKTSNLTMGPGKMKKFILGALDCSKEITPEVSPVEAPIESDKDDHNVSEDVGTANVPTPEEELQQQERTPGSIDNTVTTFACRMCRTVLFGENHLAEGHTKNQFPFKQRANHHARNGASQYQTLFCDESVLQWLAPSGTEYDVRGKLACPNCSVKIGHWNWSGIQCPDGAWVVPAIQIPLGKIDIVLPPSEHEESPQFFVVGPKGL